MKFFELVSPDTLDRKWYSDRRKRGAVQPWLYIGDAEREENEQVIRGCQIKIKP